jgi:hypothetical protein
MTGDIKYVREDGVKVSILVPRKPKKSEKTWNSATGHIYCYAGIGGRGYRKGLSTKTFQV